ncbi:MAG: phosphodiesterase YaeI [Verrucomicrobiota bacterium JB022]|nr:phosphodiesterase YaeI [Verrucomicrobiota bacterium JB022]
MAPALQLPRRRFLKLFAGCIGLSGSAYGSLHYATSYEPRHLEVTRTRIRLPHLQRVVRVVQLSDWHVSSDVPASFIHEAVTLALDQEPDIICLTGDFITNAVLERAEMVRAFKRLSVAAPTFAVLGNHDGRPREEGTSDRVLADEMIAVIREGGARLLQNEAAQVDLTAGPSLTIAGLDDLWSGVLSPQKALNARRARPQPVVVLAHNPDVKSRLLDYDWDLLLCGHTHGGQVCLPFIEGRFTPVNDQSTYSGYYRWQGRHLYVNRGVGNLHGVRFNCRPEVSLLELLPA